MCSLARVTTETLLRRWCSGWTMHHALFAWLRELAFVDSGPEGVYLHDLARDALEADLRWRDPDGYRQPVRGARDYINRRLQTSRGQNSSARSPTPSIMFRRLPGVPSPVDWAAWGQQHPEPARPADRESIMGLVLAGEGEESSTLTARWWERQA